MTIMSISSGSLSGDVQRFDIETCDPEGQGEYEKARSATFLNRTSGSTFLILHLLKEPDCLSAEQAIQ